VLAEGQVFKCHSAILAGQSDVFRAMLLADMREKATRQIRLAEIDAAALRAVLVHCYGGRLPGGPAALAAMADRLLKAADQYDLPALKRQCELALRHSLTIANCLDHLVLADLHNAAILKPVVTKFVVDNAQVCYFCFVTLFAEF
jgi:speckle-type POZ protein